MNPDVRSRPTEAGFRSEPRRALTPHRGGPQKWTHICAHAGQRARHGLISGHLLPNNPLKQKASSICPWEYSRIAFYHTVLCVYAQSCPTLCDPLDCSPPGSFVHGILQARILKWLLYSLSLRAQKIITWTRLEVQSRSLTTRGSVPEPN